jgi:chromosome segregation ATPase
MTPSKYFICRIAARLGFVRKNLRLGHAATETHLLKEAETFLGEAVWKMTENIEELSMQYWNLRKISKEHEHISHEIEQLQEKFYENYQQQTDELQSTQHVYLEFTDERKQILSRIDGLARERDKVIARARDVKRRFEGVRAKQEVINHEGNDSGEMEKIAARLKDLKIEFKKLKEQREKIAEDTAAANQRIQEIEAIVREKKQHGQSKAMLTSQSIGDANQQISSRRAQLNNLNEQMTQLYAEIGRHVSIHASTEPACAKISKKHRGLINVMLALRRSIHYNYKLAELG